jgi:hypothetical protein
VYQTCRGMLSAPRCPRRPQRFCPYTTSAMCWLDKGSPDSTMPG